MIQAVNMQDPASSNSNISTMPAANMPDTTPTNSNISTMTAANMTDTTPTNSNISTMQGENIQDTAPSYSNTSTTLSFSQVPRIRVRTDLFPNATDSSTPSTHERLIHWTIQVYENMNEEMKNNRKYRRMMMRDESNRIKRRMDYHRYKNLMGANLKSINSSPKRSKIFHFRL